MDIDTGTYRHFSFDLWLTLIRSHPDFKQQRDLLLKDFFGLDNPPEAISRTVRHYDVLCNRISERTGLHFDGSQIYCLVLEALGKDITAVTKAQLDAFYAETERLFLHFAPQLIHPQIHALLRDICEQGKTASILSNTAFIRGSTINKLLAHYELLPYFKFQLYSDETGLAKPNKRVFELLYDRTAALGVRDTKAILHIGDNPEADYQGALQAGLSAFLIS